MQDVFKTEIAELIMAFNMELDTEQIKLWYKHCKKLTDAQFKRNVDICITNCRHKPFISDVLNPPHNDNTFAPANAGAYEVI